MLLDDKYILGLCSTYICSFVVFTVGRYPEILDDKRHYHSKVENKRTGDCYEEHAIITSDVNAALSCFDSRKLRHGRRSVGMVTSWMRRMRCGLERRVGDCNDVVAASSYDLRPGFLCVLKYT